MEFRHTAVLADEVIAGLHIRPNGTYADGTLGGGGHAALLCGQLGRTGTFIGIDRDMDAIDAAADRLAGYDCKKIFVHANYADIKSVLAENDIGGLDGALLDLGVSSWQLDNPARGFSYMQDAPLDMRMDASGEAGETAALTAYDVVNGYSERELTGVIKTYGEEKWASRIAKFIVAARGEAPVASTGELVDIIKAAVPASARRDGPHPAKRTFQAIRIEVNSELDVLRSAADDFIDVLSPGGRFAVITFHSLEDRIVKEAFRRHEDPCICPKDIPMCVCGRTADVRRVNRKPILPKVRETEENPRARSAKLRIIEKI
ncbi:MAG: 16S rRNA (cytosine(1402)-N(4))-methyltransferase RsmH [Clostridiales Family XIII bacterium]|jgi:16S rRNA (cytosine1402-N4)-methyltransferase|nr:16S rRNA (cytosine(1402)-N(4))-methyltransferase RsmH [Clostridiales Family XIII bacterium]